MYLQQLEKRDNSLSVVSEENKMKPLQRKIPECIGGILVILSISGLLSMSGILIDFIDPISRTLEVIVCVGIGILGLILILGENRKKE